MKGMTVAAQLQLVASIEDKDVRRSAFRELLAQFPAIAMLVQYALHPDVKFDLPEGDIPSKEWSRSTQPNPYGLMREAKKLRNLFVGSSVSKMRKQMIYISTLNSLEPADSELLIAIVGKRMPWKTLNSLFVKKAVPELFPPVAEDELEQAGA